MKKIILAFLCCSMVALFSCHKTTRNYTLRIDLQSNYNQDSVQIILDGQTLLSKRVSTSQVLGVCTDGIAETTQKEGSHTLVIIVNSTAKTEIFPLKNDLYIGVGYYGSSKDISFNFSTEPYFYD